MNAISELEKTKIAIPPEKFGVPKEKIIPIYKLPECPPPDKPPEFYWNRGYNLSVPQEKDPPLIFESCELDEESKPLVYMTFSRASDDGFNLRYNKTIALGDVSRNPKDCIWLPNGLVSKIFRIKEGAKPECDTFHYKDLCDRVGDFLTIPDKQHGGKNDTGISIFLTDEIKQAVSAYVAAHSQR